MGTYNIPRNVKGEGRILFIFSTKSLIYTGIGAVVAFPLYLIFSMAGMWLPGWISLGVFALLGFIIGTFKIPEVGVLKTTKTVGGEKIDDIIKRFVMFKRKKNKIYIYTKEEKKNG